LCSTLLYSQTATVAPSDAPASPSSATFLSNSSGHRRRRSRGGSNATPAPLAGARSDSQPLSPLDSVDEWDTDKDRDRNHYDPFSRSPASRKMSGDRTPSPNESNGFAKPQSRKSGHRKEYGSDSTPTWAGAQERSAKVNGLAKQDGFFGKHFRSLSTSLPRFQGGDKDYSEKEKLGRGRSGGWFNSLKSVVARAGWRLRIPLTIIGAVVVTVMLFSTTREFRPILC
jgi:hypothetical protein